MAVSLWTALGCESVLDLDWTPSAPSAGEGGGPPAVLPEGAAGAGSLGGAGTGVGGDPGAPGCSSPSDCVTPPSPCDVAACTSGVCGSAPAEVGTACTGGFGPGVCDGAGTCVACNSASDCTDGDLCTAHACVHTCHDAVQNGAETDVDCGGGACPKCGGGLKCAVDSDCKKKHCVDSVCEGD